MGSGRLNWVVALMPEAQSVIKQFDLKRIESESSLFPVYESADQCVGLVISGIGKVNAAAATASLAISSANAGRDAAGWINFGIAGCGDELFGETILAGKVTDNGNSRSWFPAATWPKKVDLPRREVLTVDEPVSVYPQNGSLVEMEASGFFATAIRSAPIELVQSLKVVSDDPAHSIEGISKVLVRELCDASLASIIPWLDAFRELIEMESARLSDPPLMSEWLDRFHFSATQTHQLRRLLTEWSALNQSEGIEPFSEIADARSALKEIRRSLSAVRSELSL